MKAKARLLARGLKQRQGIDSIETFAPMPSAYCIHFPGTIACEMGLDSSQFDAAQAFVEWSLDEDLDATTR